MQDESIITKKTLQQLQINLKISYTVDATTKRFIFSFAQIVQVNTSQDHFCADSCRITYGRMPP